MTASTARAALACGVVALAVAGGCGGGDSGVLVVFTSEREIPAAAERIELSIIDVATAAEVDRQRFALDGVDRFPADLLLERGSSTPSEIAVYARLFVGRSVVARGDATARFVGGEVTRVEVPLREAGDVAPCGTTLLFADDFEDGVPTGWTFFQSGGGGYFTEAAGAVLFETTNNSVSEVGYRSDDAFDLAGGFVEISPTSVPYADSPGSAKLVAASVNGDGRAGIEYREGGLYFWEEHDGTRVNHTSLPYDRDLLDPREWRISGDTTTLRWESSNDGVTWEPRASAPMPAWARSVRVEIGSDTATAAVVPGVIVMDGFNRHAPAPVSWCPLSSAVDRFEDGAPSVDWRVDDSGGCSWVEADGKLTVDLPAGQRCALDSWGRFDLEGDVFTVELLALPPGAEVKLILAAPGGALDIEMESTAGQVRMQTQRAGATEVAGTVPYDLGAERFWRIRETAGALFWEASSDNRRYRVLAAAPHAGALDALKATVRLISTAAAPVKAELGAVSLPPP